MRGRRRRGRPLGAGHGRRTRLRLSQVAMAAASPDDVIVSEVSLLANWRRRRRRWRAQRAGAAADGRDAKGPHRAKIRALAGGCRWRQPFSCRRPSTDDRSAGPQVECPARAQPPKRSRIRHGRLHQLLALQLIVAFMGSGSSFAWQATNNEAAGDLSVVIRSQHDQLFRGVRLGSQASSWSSSWWPLESPARADVVAFLGVRYASAPVKRLRFMPPTPFTYAKQHSTHKDDNGTLVHDMRHFGPICMQRLPMELTREQAVAAEAAMRHNRPGANHEPDWRTRRAEAQAALMERLLAPGLNRAWRQTVRKLTSRFVQSEDCLNLNIYTPIEALDAQPREDSFGAAAEADLAAGRARQQQHQQQQQQQQQRPNGKPVLVLIHGDSFEFGAGSALDGRAFAQNNRVVVITLNYRLHILGFPPRAASVARGNLGLLDQVAALHWIQANVRAFGGSPERITLMGAKGGAVAVHLLMLSPLAKGLFQRAVLEDGTALSPVIANNMALSSGLGANLPRAAQQQQVANLLHLRLLAQYNDCPMSGTGASTKSRLQQNTSGQDEERQSAGALIECLKARPAETVMRHLPIELIDTAAAATVAAARPMSGGELAIPLASRWLRPLEQVLDLLIKEELKLQLDEGGNNGKGTSSSSIEASARRNQLGSLKRLLAATSGEQSPVLIEQRQLDELIGLMVGRFLRTRQNLDDGPASAVENGVDSKDGDNGDDEDSAKLMGLLSELLSAIYLPSNKTLPVGPVFVPTLEPGLILPSSSTTASASDEAGLDLASSMLRRSSPFNKRDLLIGLTRPLVVAPATLGSPNGQREESLAGGLSAIDSGGAPALAGTSLASRRLLEVGLSEEQAISQVGQFVRSFYKFHQQEISNSIINQYLSRKSGFKPTMSSKIDEISLDKQVAAARLQKQLFLANAMRELHQDSLIDVPLVKSALIHSLQQLDSLAELFVGTQLAKLGGGSSSPERPIAEDEELEQQLADERWLEEEFYKFAKAFYQDAPSWPIRPTRASHSATNRQQQQPELDQRQAHSTYLFQTVGNYNWLPQLRKTIGRLEQKASASEATTVIRSIGAILSKMIDELQGDNSNSASTTHYNRCSFRGAFEDSEDQSDRLLAQFERWICRYQLDKRLTNFLETGNMNQVNRNDHKEIPLDLLEQSLEKECGMMPRVQRDDRHLVQLDGQTSGLPSSSSAELVHVLASEPDISVESTMKHCKERLQYAAFRELAASAMSENEESNQWIVFNVFSQQLASLLTANERQLVDCPMESFMGGSELAPSQALTFDGKAAFWANFVDALNCTKTQPIGASSLSLFAQANSTLLNMNLNLNCQQPAGAQTASSVLQAMRARIKQELSQQLGVRRRLAASRGRSRGQPVANLSSSQNHHSLRMANMSNNHDHSNQQHQQQQQTSQLDGAFEMSGAGEPSGGVLWRPADPASESHRPLHRLTPLGLLVLVGALIAMSILLLGGIAIMRRCLSGSARANTTKRSSNVAPKDNGSEREEAAEPIGWITLTVDQPPEVSSGAPFDDSTVVQPPPLPPPSSLDTAQMARLMSGHTSIGDFTTNQSAATSFTANYRPTTTMAYHQSVHHDRLDDDANYDEQVGEQALLQSNNQFVPQQETSVSDQNGRSTCSSSIVLNLGPMHQDRHLPGCNLLLMHQRQQQHQQNLHSNHHHHNQLLSSSSETTTTANTQRAQSSVSLVSASTNTTSKRPVSNKKRVKISEPRSGERRLGDIDLVQPAEATALVELDANQLHLVDSMQHFCPVHRSSSNLNLIQSTDGRQLMVDDTTKYHLIGDGHHSLMRRPATARHQPGIQHQRAATMLSDNNMDASAYLAPEQKNSQQQQQVCAAHSAQHAQHQQHHRQRQQVIFANDLYPSSSSQQTSPTDRVDL